MVKGKPPLSLYNSVELFYLIWVTRSFRSLTSSHNSLTLGGNFWKGCTQKKNTSINCFVVLSSEQMSGPKWIFFSIFHAERQAMSNLQHLVVTSLWHLYWTISYVGDPPYNKLHPVQERRSLGRFLEASAEKPFQFLDAFGVFNVNDYLECDQRRGAFSRGNVWNTEFG